MSAPDHRLRLPALLEYRARAAQRRAEAFCEAPRTICGVNVRPVTPATYSALYAMRSPFVHRRAADAGDVAAFLWLHSPAFRHTGVDGWRAAKRRALRPFFRALWPWSLRFTFRRADRARAVAVVALACAEIDQLLADAFADAPAEAGRPQRPVATLEGFFTHEMAVAYGWTPERTRHTPLAQLMQLHRCIRIARGGEVTDDGEDRIVAAHLRERQAQLDTAKGAAPVKGAA